MKKKFYQITGTIVLLCAFTIASAQTNIFPASGNTGIGTITPAEKLTVLTAAGAIGVTHTDGTVKLGTYINAGAGYLGTSTNHPLCFRTNSSMAQMILLTNGNVGIGTTSPAEKFTVRSLTGVAGFAHTDGVVKIGSVVTASGALFGTLTNHPLFLRTNNAAAQVTLLQNGRVGIGTTSPVGMLDVRSGDAFIQGIRAGRGRDTYDTTNTCFGYEGLNSIYHTVDELGYDYFGYNTGIGYMSMRNATVPVYNVAVGAFTLMETTGERNTAVGAYSLRVCKTAGHNTGLGYGTLGAMKDGSNNTAVGALSLYYDTSGHDNTAVGYESLITNQGGYNNTAVGCLTLLSNRSGYNNTALGYLAMNSSNGGYQNVGVGAQALKTNTSGYENVAVGFQSADSITTGNRNASLGSYSLFRSKTSTLNTAVGEYSLYNTTGSYNTGVGAYSLYNVVGGTTNSGFGYFAGPNSGSLTNTAALGYLASTTASQQVRVGNSSVTSIGGYNNWTNISDGRVKKNIKENVPGLLFINKLRPVTYNLSLSEAEKITGAVERPAEIEKAEQDARKTKEAILYTGFVAQEVEKAAQSVDYNFSGVDAAKNNKDLYGLRYAEFVVPLVKAVQELSKKNDDLQQQVAELKAMINKGANSSSEAIQNVQLSSAKLEQNVPNPFSDFTTISYTLPQKMMQAKIVITGNDGKAIKEILVAGAGKGTTNVSTALLSAGTYKYSLYVDGVLTDTKQMILSR